MPLLTDRGAFVPSKEAASHLGMAYQTFRNRRADLGDEFLRAHTDIVPGRTYFRLEDVERLAAERGL